MIYKQIPLLLDYPKLGVDNGGYHPKITLYLAENSSEIDLSRKHPAVIICPGGGYAMTSDREAEPIALKYAAAGFHVALLRYSVGNARFPAALFETAATAALLREHAEEWFIDPDKIVVCGFSAGGHLAASLGTLWNADFVKNALGYYHEEHKPNGMILGYPVITSGEKANRGSFDLLLGEKKKDLALLNLVSLEKQVSADTPPAFLWHTCNDDVVLVENSLLFASALAQNKIPFELHVFPDGPHGLALSNLLTATGRGKLTVPECEGWIDMAIRWLAQL